MTTSKKAVVVNYSADVIANLVSDYKTGRVNGLNNNAILADLAKKYGKTVPSIRAKLAQVKAYIKDADTSEKSATKAKKSDIVEGLETLTGLSLASFEACNKSELQTLADYIDDLLSTIHDLKSRL